MSDIRYASCTSCGARVLGSTAARCGGLCMPCFKGRNHHKTPHQLDTLKGVGGTGLLEEVAGVQHAPQSFFELPAMNESTYEAWILGKVYVGRFLDTGKLDDAEAKALETWLELFAATPPDADVDARAYIEANRAIAQRVLHLDQKRRSAPDCANERSSLLGRLRNILGSLKS